MSWLWGAALLPLIVCGAMCIGGMVAAAVGLRRAGPHTAGRRERPTGDRPSR
jgi:hypothetical protein